MGVSLYAGRYAPFPASVIAGYVGNGLYETPRPGVTKLALLCHIVQFSSSPQEFKNHLIGVVRGGEALYRMAEVGQLL